jgi:hypothetical protein
MHLRSGYCTPERRVATATATPPAQTPLYRAAKAADPSKVKRQLFTAYVPPVSTGSGLTTDDEDDYEYCTDSEAEAE